MRIKIFNFLLDSIFPVFWTSVLFLTLSGGYFWISPLFKKENPSVQSSIDELENRLTFLEKQVQEDGEQITSLHLLENRAIEKIIDGLERKCK